MATYTTYYQLTKPQGADLYNIQDFNGNADIIDGRMHTNAMNIEYTQNMIATVISDPTTVASYHAGDKCIVGNNLYVVTTSYSGMWSASYAQPLVLGDYLAVEDISSKITAYTSDIIIFANHSYKKSGIAIICCKIECINSTALTANTWNTVLLIDNTDFGYVPPHSSMDIYGNSESGSKVRLNHTANGWGIQIYPATATTEEEFSIMYMTED